MRPEVWLGIVLLAGAALSITRLLVAHLRSAQGQRPALWRTLALAGLTAASALLLHRTLLPPTPAGPDTLVVLTANAGGLPVPAGPVVALPEADGVPAGATRMPDLATALRRHPERPLDTGITRALWMTYAEIAAARARLRSPLVLSSLDAWLGGQRLPLTTLRSLLPGREA